MEVLDKMEVLEEMDKMEVLEEMDKMEEMEVLEEMEKRIMKAVYTWMILRNHIFKFLILSAHFFFKVTCSIHNGII